VEPPDPNCEREERVDASFTLALPRHAWKQGVGVGGCPTPTAPFPASGDAPPSPAQPAPVPISRAWGKEQQSGGKGAAAAGRYSSTSSKCKLGARKQASEKGVPQRASSRRIAGQEQIGKRGLGRCVEAQEHRIQWPRPPFRSQYELPV